MINKLTMRKRLQCVGNKCATEDVLLYHKAVRENGRIRETDRCKWSRVVFYYIHNSVYVNVISYHIMPYRTIYHRRKQKIYSF